MISRISASAIALALLVGILGPASGSSATASDASWMQVSFVSRIQPSDRELIERFADGPIFYSPPNAYVAWMRGDAERLLSTPRVSSVRPLTAEDKQASITGDMAAVVVHASAIDDRLLDAASSGWASSPDRRLVTLLVPARLASTFAELPSVLSVGPGSLDLTALDEQSSQIVAGNTELGRPVVGYRAFLDEIGVDGTGVRLAIADSGIDDEHPDLAGRVVARTDFTQLPDYRDSDGHGTHVAGIAAGGGVLQGANDPNGFHYGLGVAPRVDLVDVGVLGIIEETVGIDELPPFEQATSYAINQGAFGWNASWGSGDGDRVGYVENARTMDLLARDGDWEEPGAQPFILVFAAGNSSFNGPGAPTEAKNLISVAASRSARAGNIETIASFSSRGPTKDGRIGPTIAAPGEFIVAPRSTASVLCNTPPREASPLVVLYATCSGTSMAAPHVAGAVSLLVQWWGQRYQGAVPSPAMAKAMLVNSAHDMGLKDIPNIHEGWGRVNLKEMFDPNLERVLLDQVTPFDAVGEEHAWTIEPVDPSRPMKISLVWSDAAAAPNASPALVNDLDLSLVSGSSQYRGNVFSQGMSVLGGSADRLEVVENIFVADPSGAYTLKVRAANLPGDGVPGGDGTDQDHALVMSNARIV